MIKMNREMNDKNISRRDFLKTATVMGATLTVEPMLEWRR
jgi:Ni,Fe-hydrogenase I small subunit